MSPHLALIGGEEFAAGFEDVSPVDPKSKQAAPWERRRKQHLSSAQIGLLKVNCWNGAKMPDVERKQPRRSL